MLTWLVLAGLAFAFGGTIAYKVGQKRGRRGAEALPPGGSGGAGLLERTLRDVRPDDVVQHAGRDWLVEGIVRYEEDGHTWRGARLIDGTEEAWLVLGLDRTPALDVRLLRVDPSVTVGAHPPDTIALGDVLFTLVRRGNATANGEGELGGFPGAGKGVVRGRWWRYGAPGDRALLVEQWGDTFRALVGETVPEGQLELLAA